MNSISIPKEYSYIAAFLTMSCPLRCSYCINIMEYNRSAQYHGRKPMSAEEWIKALNRIEAREDLPITLQGGEPTAHPEFYKIVNGVDRPMDLLTNCQFDLDVFSKQVSQEKFMRNAPYASIRVSYHPEQMRLEDTVKRVKTLKDRGYQIGVWMVHHPDWQHHFVQAEESFKSAGIDFRWKELLGEVKHKDGVVHVHGTIKYPGAVGAKGNFKTCMCRTRELIIAPDGSIHRCHSDLYNLRKGIGHVLEPDFQLDREFRFCGVYGNCNACDVKVKTDRFQVMGYTAVEIINIEEDIPHTNYCTACKAEIINNECSNTLCTGG